MYNVFFSKVDTVGRQQVSQESFKGWKFFRWGLSI